MSKVRANITNNRLDGFSEVKIIGDISSYDGDWLAQQIDNLTDRETYKGTKNLRMRVNSFGGSVYAGFTTVSAMQRFMDAGGLIETINEGCADSTAGWLAACGTRGHRKVMQFATGFLHAPMFEDGRTLDDLIEGTPEHDVLKDNFDKLINIFVSATGKPYSRIKDLMVNETELSASELVKEGFADEIVMVDNVPKIKNGITRAEVVNITNGLVIDIKKKENAPSERDKIVNMKSINEILNLSPEASEGATRQAIDGLINSKKKAESDLAAMTEKHRTAESELTNLKNTVKEAEEAEIVNYVDELIKLDARKKDQKDSLINMAKGDFSTFKSVMPLEKAVVDGAVIDDGVEEEAPGDEKKLGIENARKFYDMPQSKKEELKNENLPEYRKLAGDYDKYFSEVK